MKKLFILLAALLVISGMVGAQVLTTPNLPAGSALDDINSFDAFNVVPTLSTESRYSAGIFGSYVDDFIDVNFFDPEAGTFFFLGGYPAGASVDATLQYTSGFWALSAGFAQTFNFGYIGAYYGGSLVDAAGYSDGQATAATGRYTQWENNLAVLLALNALPGAFRLDFWQNTRVQNDSVGSNTVYHDRQNAPALALTYGGLKIAGFNPYVTVGYQFNELDVIGALDADNKYYKQTTTGASLFSIEAGTYYDIDDYSWLYGALVFTLDGASSTSGDNYVGLPNYNDTEPATFDVINNAGGWTAGLAAAYSYTMEFGQLSFGFKPNLRLGYNAGSTSAKDRDGAYETAAQNFFQVDTGVDVGLKFQLNEQFAFYTGASLQIIDFRTMYYSGGKDYSGITDVDSPDYGRGDTRRTGSTWDIDGLQWDTRAWNTNSNLGFGMTFSPMENLVIGAGLNSVIDKLFYIDLAGMRVGTGTWFEDPADNGQNNFLSEALRLFDDISFDLTVSYKL